MKVIVTGAAQGIGRAIALKIAKDYQGAKLLLNDLNIACQSTLVAGKSMPCGIESQSGYIHHYGIGLGHTPMTQSAYTQPGVMAQRESRIPLRRIGQPEDIAKAVAFLMSPEANYITGADIVVDGGLTQTLMAYNPGWKT